ncbi:biopolymer transporter ExbB [Donghicola mangrovi]|uniref:Biopolymer transporter ExbB n=1 Tax=Donghicola mangrovi TaxID=2729614 RepID=A0A850Q7D5_9RHOB|nr:biopolymer transporter ExbB [Donghicola mangrovi]NVO24092.1 biopolymer transporter ExbB [Donghicola mangrovi]
MNRESEPHFSQPIRQIFLMVVALGLTGAGASLAYGVVRPLFVANPWLNGTIALVFVFGVLACFVQVGQLISSVRWIEAFTDERVDTRGVRAPRLLKPLAALLSSHGKRMKISSTAAQSILDSLATRIDEAREITRYVVNLLIFLGLLGTFYGLATTVPAVVDTIRSLAPSDGSGSGAEMFSHLMKGLESQLGGMGTAFSSSLLGLAGSLVVGLLELFAGHGQNRFYRELEEWLTSITRLGYVGDTEGASPEQAAVVQVLEQMADQMEQMQAAMLNSDSQRNSLDEHLSHLTRAVDRMGEKMSMIDNSDLAHGLQVIANGQQQMVDALQMMVARGGAGGAGVVELDEESRMRLRSIDLQMLQLLEDMNAGRQETLSELRTDIAALTRAVQRLGSVDTATPRRPREEG